MTETFLDLQEMFQTTLESQIVKHFDASATEDDQKQEFLEDQLRRFVSWGARWGNRSQIFLEHLLEKERKEPNKFHIRQAMKLK